MWKTPTNCGDKKTTRFKTYQLNPLFEIKLHRFTWTPYPKDLLFNTYNLIHFRDATTLFCSLVDPLTTSNGLRSSTLNSNIQIFEWDIRKDVAL